ncbi:integrase catalytic domain-containing protein [Trichonephila clavata]|uniref:Integrase catalytic domain-containing protein n=1 Tax=Trichonephila clavata TaxID=2740835 RepID=A0A8X6HFU0_TRICU|nr:integrase catalytic domain-containing protein [Trichonephila clavata]
MVRNFWNLESIGLQPIQEKLRLSTHNAELLTNFHQSFKIIDGRRVVHLPWKLEVQLTSSSYDTTIHRFNSWTRRIHANTELKQKNQVRIVFDASSHSPGHPSLNDALEAGPNLLPDILATLLRFRLSKIAITSDGSQVFLQLILADEDRDATRFLWYKTEHTSDGKLCITDEIVIYRFTLLPFGLTSSPFLLSASLRELATMYKQTYPIATKHIENNTYMDDFVIGTSTDTEAITLYREMLQFTSHISLPLTKWTTNSKILQDVWKQENVPFRDITQVLDEESLSTVLIGIEAALNSRPLVYEEESDDNSAALTPAHFLTGRKLTAIPSGLENPRLNKIYKQQQDLLDCFWKKWSKEYLLQLRSFHQVRNKDSAINIRVGDIVLLEEDVRPRHIWKKARVMNLHQGCNGKIRSCELRVNGRNLTRPVQLVIPLEIDQGGRMLGTRLNVKFNCPFLATVVMEKPLSIKFNSV